MSIEAQARQVHEVKRAENGMIYEPVTINPDATVGDALAMMKDYHIGGIPVINNESTLIGIVTNRDLRFQQNMRTPIREVMTSKNIITTNQSTNLEEAAEILKQYKIEKLPVVDENNKLIGLLTYKDITKIKITPMQSRMQKGRLRVAAGVGVTPDTLDRVKALYEANVDAVVIDTAHGHSKGVVDMLKLVKKEFPQA